MQVESDNFCKSDAGEQSYREDGFFVTRKNGLLSEGPVTKMKTRDEVDKPLLTH